MHHATRATVADAPRCVQASLAAVHAVHQPGGLRTDPSTQSQNRRVPFGNCTAWLRRGSECIHPRSTWHLQLRPHLEELGVRRLRSPPNGHAAQGRRLYGACAGCLEAIPAITCWARPASRDSTTCIRGKTVMHHSHSFLYRESHIYEMGRDNDESPSSDRQPQSKRGLPTTLRNATLQWKGTRESDAWGDDRGGGPASISCASCAIMS